MPRAFAFTIRRSRPIGSSGAFSRAASAKRSDRHGGLIQRRGIDAVEATWSPGVIRNLKRYVSCNHIAVPTSRWFRIDTASTYLEQTKNIDFAALFRPITHFDYLTFLDIYRLGDPQASNFFVVIYTSESPLSGNPSMETIFPESDIGARERGNLLHLINKCGQCCC